MRNQKFVTALHSLIDQILHIPFFNIIHQGRVSSGFAFYLDFSNIAALFELQKTLWYLWYLNFGQTGNILNISKVKQYLVFKQDITDYRMEIATPWPNLPSQVLII